MTDDQPNPMAVALELTRREAENQKLLHPALAVTGTAMIPMHVTLFHVAVMNSIAAASLRQPKRLKMWSRLAAAINECYPDVREKALEAFNPDKKGPPN